MQIGVESRDEYPLSFAQERLWFIEQYEQGTNAYHIPVLVELAPSTDRDKLSQAICAVVSRHEVLRTVFEQGDTEYLQKVLTDPLMIGEYSYRDTDLDAQVTRDINTPFALQEEYPIRVCFYEYRDRVRLLINIHHIASDGWSEDILFKEIDALYKGEPLSDLAIQYKDFAVWQRRHLSGDLLESQQSYWQDKLSGYEPLLIPTDRTRPGQVDYSGEDVGFSLSVELSRKLRALSQENGCTLYTTLLSGFYIFLNKYTGQGDLILGTPIANRHYSELEDLIGFFVNSLALREELNNDDTILDLLPRVQANLIEAQAHQDLPFEKVVDALGVEQDTSRHPIFQVMFGVQSFVGSSSSSLFSGLSLEENYSIAKYDLSCFLDDSGELIAGNFNFAKALYDRSTIERMISHYELVLEQMVDDQRKVVRDYMVLSSEEYDQQIYEWNSSERVYPKDRTIHSLFEAQVAKNPEATAVVFEGESLSYAELNARSNQVARYLRSESGITSDSLIGICMDRSLSMLVGILGILKSGGAYVPIDPGYPAERIGYILSDTGTSLVLTEESQREFLSSLTSAKLLTLTGSSYGGFSTENLLVDTQAEDLAYVIYTSGTTGNPKGVMQSHGNVQRLFSATDSQYQFSNSDVWTLYHSFIFDFSVWEIWGALLYGGKLIVPNTDTVKDISKFIDLCIDSKVTVLNQTPRAFYTFAENLVDKDISALALKYIIFGGDALDVNLLNNWWAVKREFDLKTTLVNMYGITETTVHVTYREVVEGDTVASNIGKAIDDLSSYVLDTNGAPVPIGVVGELHIGGAGLARGYLNQPELTSERFIANPFASVSDAANGYTRLYKTGDLVRWLPDGNLEYIGRNDFQVKIRGYRIELGEIEHALSGVAGVQQSCVVCKEKGGSKYLVGYYISDSSLDDAWILSELSKHLPSYMLPGALIALDSFPLTINGKLDRKALPDVDFSSDDSYHAPETALEFKLCEIWGEVLNLERVGIHDDFFRIGGDSILSIQLSSRLRNAGLQCSVREVFDHRTVSKLSVFLSGHVSKTVEVLAEQGVLEGEFDLLSVQKWFFAQRERGTLGAPNHWNQSFLVKVPELDKSRLHEVVHSLVEHHDMLRVLFSIDKQRYCSAISIPEVKILDVEGWSEQDLSAALTDLQSDFDIETGPLWRVAYLEGYSDKSSRLFFAFHHLIIDTVSWRILIEDFKALYAGELLNAKSSSYRQWVEELSTYSEKHPEEKAYWSSLLEKAVSPPCDQSEVFSRRVTLSVDATRSLLQNANKAYYTEVNDVLLTSLGLALQSWNDSATQLITLEGHGREELNAKIDHSRTTGWFTTLYPVELVLGDDFGSSIKSVKEGLRSIPNKGIGFGALFPDELINLPRVSFNYLGQFDSQDDYWQIVSEDSGRAIDGTNVDGTLLNINGMVVSGQLSFRVDSRLTEHETVVFAANFEKALLSVIEHCEQKLLLDEREHTPSDFPTVELSCSLLDDLQKRGSIEGIYPATSLQQGFIYHALSQRSDDAYRVQFLFDYRQSLNVDHYLKSWDLAVEKYPILRTGFNWEEEIVQVIYSSADLSTEFFRFE